MRIEFEAFNLKHVPVYVASTTLPLSTMSTTDVCHGLFSLLLQGA